MGEYPWPWSLIRCARPAPGRPASVCAAWTQRRHYAVAPSAEVAGLERKIEELQLSLRTLADRQAVKQASINHLNGMREATSEICSWSGPWT